MKMLKRLFFSLLFLLLLLVAGLFLTGNSYILKALRTTYLRGHATASIDDHPYFYNRTIEKGNPQNWKEASTYNSKNLSEKLQKHNDKYNTVAFLVAKNGALVFEKYWHDYHKDSQSNSFSMAKSLVTMLMDQAIKEGKIKSLEQPISDFFPQYKEGIAAKVTVGDLSRMSSGLDWKEYYYSPINITTEAYYKKDLKELILSLGIVDEPGKGFNYQSGTTQLLGLVIEKATGKNLSEYLTEKFWKPMGMRNDALWSLDTENGIEKAYCCVNANARDFAKFGQLLLQDGQWKGQQLISRNFVDKMRKPAFSSSPEYGYSLWMDLQHENPFYSLQGHLGQYVIVLPEQNIVLCRFGETRTLGTEVKEGSVLRAEIYMMVDEVVKVFGN